MRHSEILQILQNLTKHKPTQQEIADILDVSISTIGARASRDSNYSIPEIKKIGDMFNVNLFTKTAQQGWDELQGQNHYEVVSSIAKAISGQEQNEDTIDVDYFPDVFGSCGGGAFVLSEQKEKVSVPKRYIDDFSSIKQYSVINAYGDSMMPYIQDRDELIVEHCHGEQIKDNRVYVFRHGDHLFIKRLVLNINQLIIKSDNTMYEPIVLKDQDLEDFEIIGKIVGLFRRMG